MPDREMTAYFQSTPRPQMLEQDKQTLRAILAKYRAERWIKDEAQQQSLEATLENNLDRIYSETRTGLGKDSESDSQNSRRQGNSVNDGTAHGKLLRV